MATIRIYAGCGDLVLVGEGVGSIPSNPPLVAPPEMVAGRGKRRRPAEFTSDGRRSNSKGPHETLFRGNDGEEVTIVRQNDILAIVE